MSSIISPSSIIHSPHNTISVLQVINDAIRVRTQDRKYSNMAQSRFRKMALKQFGQVTMEYDEFVTQLESFMDYFEKRHLDQLEEVISRNIQKVKERERHIEGVASYISDEMEPQYHERARRMIDSRSAWRKADKDTGAITLSPNEWTAPGMQADIVIKDEQKELVEDRRQASRRAMEAYERNESPLTDDQKELCKKQDEAMSHKLGYDVEKIWTKSRKLKELKRKQRKKIKK
jgi:hypothetical protein